MIIKHVVSPLTASPKTWIEHQETRVGLGARTASRRLRFVAAWVWLIALAACGKSEQPATVSADSGGATAGNTQTSSSAAGSGGLNAAGSSGSNSGGASAGGDTSGSAATDPKTKGEACVFYARHRCEKLAKCEGKIQECA